MKKLITAMILLCVTMLVSGRSARAALIYASDHQGNVAQYDTDTQSLSVLGTLAGFRVDKVMGLAYDPVADSVLIIDRNGSMVYSMDVQTGAAAPLFSFSREFQGGAVKGGLLYGVDEVTQTIEAYSLSDFADQGLSMSVGLDHTHALGVDAASGQLYSQSIRAVDGQIRGVFREVSGNGTVAEPPALVSQTDFFYNDIDYWDGNFLGMIQGRGVDLINGSTGATSALVTYDQLRSIGLDIDVAGHGIAVRAVPLPASSLIWLAFALLGAILGRYRCQGARTSAT